MIPSVAIEEWCNQVPWKDWFQVEQDLLICRCLVAIFQDEFLASQLAFRGGTAMHKLYFHPQPRYSEDIDLVQIHPGPIKPILQRLGEVLSFFRGYLLPNQPSSITKSSPPKAAMSVIICTIRSSLMSKYSPSHEFKRMSPTFMPRCSIPQVRAQRWKVRDTPLMPASL